jgi:hypothetical protein
MTENTPRYDREIVAIFRSPQRLDAAVSDLCSAGWDRAELSLLGPQEHLAPGKNSAEQATDPSAPRTPVFSDSDARQERTLAASLAGVVAGFIASGAIVATGGTAVVALIGAAAAGGSGVAAGEFIGRMFNKNMTEPMEDQIAQGGIVLWALLRSADQESQARAILAKHDAADIHVQAHAG